MFLDKYIICILCYILYSIYYICYMFLDIYIINYMYLNIRIYFIFLVSTNSIGIKPFKLDISSRHMTIDSPKLRPPRKHYSTEQSIIKENENEYFRNYNTSRRKLPVFKQDIMNTNTKWFKNIASLDFRSISRKYKRYQKNRDTKGNNNNDNNYINHFSNNSQIIDGHELNKINNKNRSKNNKNKKMSSNYLSKSRKKKKKKKCP